MSSASPSVEPSLTPGASKSSTGVRPRAPATPELGRRCDVTANALPATADPGRRETSRAAPPLRGRSAAASRRQAQTAPPDASPACLAAFSRVGFAGWSDRRGRQRRARVPSRGPAGPLGYHFIEWLAAIVLHYSTGYLALVSKYEFPRHRRKQRIVEELLPTAVRTAPGRPSGTRSCATSRSADVRARSIGLVLLRGEGTR